MEIIRIIRFVIFLVGLYNILVLLNEKEDDAPLKISLDVIVLFIAGLLTDPASWPDKSYFFDHIPRVITIFVLNSIIWGALFWVSFIVRIIFLIQHKKNVREEQIIAQQKDSDAAKLLALEELESGHLDKLTWANAMIRAKGDENKAKAEYLRIRKK